MANAVRVPTVKPIDLSGVSRSLDNIFSSAGQAVSGIQTAAGGILETGKKGVNSLVDLTKDTLDVSGDTSGSGRRLIDTSTEANKRAEAKINAENARAEADYNLKQKERMKFQQIRGRQKSLIGGSQGRQSTILTSYLGQSGASSSAGKTLLGM